MKYLLSGVALAAALAISASAGAQSSGAPASPSAMPPPTSSAMPPMKRAARPHHATHAKTMHHGPTSTTDTTAQLNRAELARVTQAAPPPPMPNAPPPPQLQGGNSMGMPGPAAGGPGLTPYSTGTQPPR